MIKRYENKKSSTLIREKDGFEKLSNEIQDKIDFEEEEIETLSLTLKQTRRLRRHKMECESMSKTANQIPSRSSSQAQLESLMSKMSEMAGQENLVEDEIDLRRRQFSFISSFLSTISSTISSDTTTTTTTTSSLSDMGGEGGDEMVDDEKDEMEEEEEEEVKMIKSTKKKRKRSTNKSSSNNNNSKSSNNSSTSNNNNNKRKHKKKRK